jgi:hypothetical protein
MANMLLDASEIGSQRPPCRAPRGRQNHLRNQNGGVVKTRHSSVCSLSSVVLCSVVAHNKIIITLQEDEARMFLEARHFERIELGPDRRSTVHSFKEEQGDRF